MAWQGALLSVLFGLTLLPAFGEPSIVERERARRAVRTEEAQAELKRGDTAYEAAKYADAVDAYAAARGLLSEGSLTGDLRTAATQRYAQASVERARELAKGGRRDDAEALLDSVLSRDVLPTYAPAQQLKEQIFDPIRYNPALTAESVAEVDKVRRLLYEAEGFASLGQYDRALEMYQEVLRIDLTNTAARRGMETIHARRSDYYMAARDEARATMLAEVARAWEIPVNPVARPVDAGLGMIRDRPDAGRTAAEKLRGSIVPVVDLQGATLAEAVDFLRQQSINLDDMEPDPDQRGISFVIDLGNRETPVTKRIETTRLNLQLRNVPLGEVLNFITSATGTKVRVDEYAVVISPEASVSNDLIFRRWRVPPDFLSRESIDGAGNDDVFAPPSKALLGAKLTAQEFLKKQGVTFPEGATAGFTAFNSTLSVRNTRSNIDFVDQIVDSIMGDEPVAVKVEVRFVNVTQDRLSELGFDWLISGVPLGKAGFGDDMFLGGGTVGNGTSIDDFAVNLDPVTSGLRSGAATQPDNSIDALIRAGSRSSDTTDQDSVRAPGILAVAGVWDDGTVATLMRGLGRDKGTDWSTTKSVMTRSGQSASIQSVREMIVPTEYDPPKIPNNVNTSTFVDLTTGETASEGISFATPATPTDFEQRVTGCIMEVEPLVGPDRRYVEVALKPQVITFDGFIDYGTPINGGSSSPMINLGGVGNPNVPVFTNAGSFGQVTQNSILMPIFSVTRTDTNLTILDGSTIVLGGLMSDSHLKYEDKVPILGDIPLVGRFFTSNSETIRKTALLIFVKVELLDPAGYRYRNR
jgi:general secretion pathway protein D